MHGKLILVVGPSGVGKDTLIDGARIELAGDERFHFARRAITRAADAGGEDHEAISVDEFERRRETGAFFASWRAHGLDYGVPATIVERLTNGQNVILNGSRGQVANIAAAYPNVDVITIDAPPELIERRLRLRGRESEADVLQRRLRPEVAPVEGVTYATVMNSGSIADGVAQLITAILGAAYLPLRLRCAAFEVFREPFCLLNAASHVVAAANLGEAQMVEITAGPRSARARLALTTDDRLAARDEAALSPFAFEQLGVAVDTAVTIQRSPSPKSRGVLRRKLGGAALCESELRLVMRDLVEGRYSAAETAGFLVSASGNLCFDEIVALTRVRAEYMQRFDWGSELVVDKHSMGGIPGSRITLIVVPIVAAHGLTIPKTSSRAITSAAGTADAMEVLARVDLTHDEMRAVVERCHGCIAWNGRINHSPVDDVMNAINRSLGVPSKLLDVTSILSKKIAAGSTHVLMDIPFGPYAKLKTEAAARELADLFERVGNAVGLTVAARPTDGAAPIGRGVGAALEVRDVMAVLDGNPAAPRDLRDKALTFAGAILEWDPTVAPGCGRNRAEHLLFSGAAREVFDRVVDAQGRHATPGAPGQYHREIRAPRGGVVAELDGFVISGLARAAGAPTDKSAGIDILVGLGEPVLDGQPVLRVHAASEAALSRAFSDETPAAAVRVA